MISDGKGEFKGKCSNCHETGHRAHKCPHKKEKEAVMAKENLVVSKETATTVESQATELPTAGRKVAARPKEQAKLLVAMRVL